MNFIVYLLVLLAWAPNFGLAQNSGLLDSMSKGLGEINQEIRERNKILEACQKIIAVQSGGAGLLGSGKK